jgi:predicted dehydrogenase
MAVIGVGHLGKEHARILAGFPDIDLVGVADINSDQAHLVARRCGARPFNDYWPLLNLVDAAILAVPTVHHHAIAKEFLRRGIPLLVEKPLASTVAQADELVALAQQHETLLQVGHIERFNPAFEELARRPMQPKFIECERLGPYTGRSIDIGVVLDLMIHDLDLLLGLMQATVRSVDAVGVSIFGGHEDVASARLAFANGCIANLTASRASGAALRRMRIWSPEGYAHLDLAKRTLTFVQPSPELQTRGLPAGALSRIKEDMFERYLQVLRLERKEGDQLTRELREFIGCLTTGESPRVGGEEARNALALAHQVIDSLAAHQWEGHADGPIGPHQLPAPLGPLFRPAQGEAAA